MNRDRLGFMSAIGAVVAGVALLGVVGWTLLAGPVLFSPGALNAVSKSQTLGGVRNHAQLAGRCEACHTTPWSSQTMVDRCLACHAEIGSQIQGHIGLHGRLLGTLTQPTCRGCHTEHNGASGALTVRDPATFPHDLTRFSLRHHSRGGRGSVRMTCEDCHPKSLTEFDVSACAACHESLNAAFMQRHVGTFGKKCLLCHDGKTDGSTFDHNSLPFALTGKHVGLQCARCHPEGSLQSAALTPRDCGACHAKDDKHKGTFGTQCAQCHSTSGWPGAQFDHTVFPVDHGNRGQSSNCQTCHPNGTSAYTCYGCHEHTVPGILARHGGRTAAQLADCIQCHKGGRTEGG